MWAAAQMNASFASRASRAGRRAEEAGPVGTVADRTGVREDPRALALPAPDQWPPVGAVAQRDR